MKLSSQPDVRVEQKSPRTALVSHGDLMKMLTRDQNRVAMPTSAFRVDMLSTKSDNKEL